MFERLLGAEPTLAARFFLAIAALIVGLGTLILVRRIVTRAHLKFPDFRASFRTSIVSAFEQICIAIVVIPTGLAVLAALMAAFGDVPVGASREDTVLVALLIAGAIFLMTIFLAGGALTLVSIMENTHEIARMLQRMEDKELRSIADDVHRMEGAERDARNLNAVGNAVLSVSIGVQE